MADNPPLTSDAYGPPDTRCPSCRRFVTEGTKHVCPKGRHRDPFINPATEKGS